MRTCPAMSGVCATWRVPWAASWPFARLWWIYGSYTPSSCVRTGQAAAAGNAHWPRWEEPRSEKVRSKDRSDLAQRSVSRGILGLARKTKRGKWIMLLIFFVKQYNENMKQKSRDVFFLNGICRRLHIWFVLQTIPLNNYATADPRTHFASSSLQYPNIFSTSKPLSLFQLPLSLILCTSAAIFPALSLCETQLSVVQHSLGRPPKASDHTCMLLPTRVGSGGRPSVCYRLVPLSLLSYAQHWHHVPT